MSQENFSFINLEKTTNNIYKLASHIEEFLLNECTKHPYIVQELYLAVKYVLFKYGLALGKEAVKRLESSCHFIAPKDLEDAPKC